MFIISVNVEVVNGKNIKIKLIAPANDLLKLNLTTSYNVKVVQVSFDGNDGEKGLLQIKETALTIVVLEIEEELIKSPNYFTINVSEFPLGDYTFIIKTQKNTYASTITIK